MARRLIAFPVRVEGGRVIGGSGTELRLYTDPALSLLATLYAAEAGGTTIPNPRTPNAGVQSPLAADRLAADTFVTVQNVSDFAVGDTVPIYDGTNTVYRVITAITVGTKRLDLSAALGFNFLAANTLVGNRDMKGHVGCWLDTGSDYYIQSKNVASTRVLPPMQVPVQVPVTTIDVQEEGSLVGTRGKLNLVGPNVLAADDAPNSRVNVTVDGYEDLGDITGAVTVDWGNGRTTKRARLTGNVTFTFDNLAAGRWVGLLLVQDGAGGRTVSWPASAEFPNNVAPTLSAAGKADLISGMHDGTTLRLAATTGYD